MMVWTHSQHESGSKRLQELITTAGQQLVNTGQGTNYPPHAERGRQVVITQDKRNENFVKGIVGPRFVVLL